MTTFKLIRKVSTIKSIVNRLLRIPKRTTITKLDTGIVTEVQVYNNKQIIIVR